MDLFDRNRLGKITRTVNLESQNNTSHAGDSTVRSLFTHLAAAATVANCDSATRVSNDLHLVKPQ